MDSISPYTLFLEEKKQTKVPPEKFKIELVWSAIIFFSSFHLGTLYALLFVLPNSNIRTAIFTIGYGYISLLGITAGVHRLWSHRSYKAKLPLRLFLAFCQTITLQYTIWRWARDHREHHKYSDTNGDPHNAKRGLFYSHIGWLLCKKHPELLEKGKTIWVDDLNADPVVQFQRKYYTPLAVVCSIIIPTILPNLLWNETYWNSFFVCFVLRFICIIHITFLINSLAHALGERPYDVNIHPTENKFVSFFVIGEGFHNYHHTFPMDYAASEWGMNINLTTMFLNLMAKLGQAYDLKTVSKNMIKQRMERTGLKAR